MILKPSRIAAGCAAACLVSVIAAVPAHALPGDIHINGTSTGDATVDCNGRTLFVNGTKNTVWAKGACWAVTMQGSGNTVIAETVINDITVYGWDQTVIYKDGAPFIWDRGLELGMTNRIDRIPG